MKVTIACSLAPSEAKAQLGQWQQLRRIFEGVERASPHQVELGLLPEADLTSVVGLAQKEKACCPFFTFSVEIEATRLALELADG
jgi:hypothetical protein